jgi:uncharacterized delta-60 repeat protein
MREASVMRNRFNRTHLNSSYYGVGWVFAFSSKYTKGSIITKLFRIPYIGILTFALTGSPFAQEIIWQRVFDTGEPDWAGAVAIDPNDNVIVVGTTVPDLIDPNDHGDFLVVKYSLSGDTLWTRHYNRTHADYASGVAIDHSGNIIVAGSTMTDSTPYHAHIVKFTPNGDTIWTRTFYGRWQEEADAAYAVVIDSKGNIIIAGEGHSTPYSYSDYLTLKYDTSGTLLWARWYDNTWEDVGQDVAVDDSDNVIVTGYSNNGMNWDWCTIKYSPNGDTLRVRRYDVSLDDWAHGVATDRKGNIIVCGEIHRGNGHTGMVVKYTPVGDTLWTKLFTDTLQFAEVRKFVDITTDDQGNIYLTGQYDQWDTLGKLWSDYYVAKCNSSGDTLWTVRYDYDREDEASGIALDRLGNILVTGTSNRSPEVYERNYLTIKIKDNVNSIDDGPPFPQKVVLYPSYPNPFNPITTIEFALPTALHVTLKIYNLLGQELETLVDERKGPGRYDVKWDASRCGNGTYIARFTAGDYVASQKLLLIK